MKKPDEMLGTARKTLPTRRSRTIKRGTSPLAKRAAKTKNPLDKDVETELVKVFGEK